MSHWIINSSLAILFTCFVTHTSAQDSIAQSKKMNVSNSNINRNADRGNSVRNLKESIEKEDNSSTAKNYENLGDADLKQQNYQKAENNFRQALNYYKKDKNKSKISEVNRKIARSQEAQNKDKEAAESYSAAEKTASTSWEQQMNFNDAIRMDQSQKIPIEQQRSAYEDVANMHQAKGQSEAASEVYKNLAEVEIKNNNLDEAKATLEKAMETATNAENKAAIKQQMAEVLAKDNQVPAAISLSKKLLQEAQDSNNVILQLDQLSQLATFYHTTNQLDSSIHFLNNAYQLSIKNALTKEAKKVTDTLVSYLQQHQKTELANEAYQRFYNDLDSLLTNDKSLLDENMTAVTEQRISELEKEKKLQAAVIENKNRFNYVLIGSLIIMLGLIGMIARSLYFIKKKNKKIALQSLRREMNPHFIFNSLNSVNQFIAENNELEANKYLTSYSSLMRNVMEHSNNDFVKLSVEIDQLKKYLSLEHLRFKNQFDYEIHIDEIIDEEMLYIPNMLIQPQLENAVWHGLRYQSHKGTLKLIFQMIDQHIIASIQDNGIGIEQSKAMKTKHQKSHQSIGINNTQQRIQLLNDLYKTNIHMQIDSDQNGTIVKLDFGTLKTKEA